MPKKQIRREDVQATSPRQAVRRGMVDQGSTARLRAAVRANPKLEEEIASLDLLDDAALWNAARTTMPQANSERMEAFHRKQRLTGLSDAETQELVRLEQQYGRVILVRTHSAELLEQRGHDIRRLFSSSEERAHLTEAMNRVIEEVGSDADEFSQRAARRVLEKVEW